tara:strand:+ start:155 stop:382 length:228 start_codon:yes stop_codon:yes gene_type:complete
MPHKTLAILNAWWIGALDMLTPVSKETAQLPAGATTRAVQGPRGAGAYICMYKHTDQENWGVNHITCRQICDHKG